MSSNSLCKNIMQERVNRMAIHNSNKKTMKATRQAMKTALQIAITKDLTREDSEEFLEHQFGLLLERVSVYYKVDVENLVENLWDEISE